MKLRKSSEIITVPSLKSFFYEALTEINNSVAVPVHEKAIFYSSDVLERYSLSKEYFESTNGRVQDKVLGLKLLEAGNKSDSEKESIYRDVAETALILCGCFSQSIDGKLVDQAYYAKLGKVAFSHMEIYRPNFLDFPNFFGMMSKSFERLTNIIELMSVKNSPATILEKDISSSDAAVLGITLVKQTKVS